MRIFRNSIILVIFLAVIAIAGKATGAGITEQEPKVADTKLLLVPYDNPLKDHEANTMVWNSAYDLSTWSVDWLAEGFGWNNFLLGRVLHIYYGTDYLAYATNYYSHEIAHYFTNKNSPRFWIDLSDWHRGVPEFKSYEFYDMWDIDQWALYQTNPKDPKILNWLLLTREAGLCQNRFNAKYRAHYSATAGLTTMSDGVFFCRNQIDEAEYITRWGDTPVDKEKAAWEVLGDLNDVTAYVYFMDLLGSDISRDAWLACSVASVLASGQTWNSVRAIFNFIFHGDEGVENIEFGLGKSLRMAPPNFYLFPSVRGLYVESETYFRNLLRDGDGFFLSLGAGLDALGLENTGPVNRLRIGGQYQSISLPYSIEVQPFLNLDFTNGFKQTGYSIGSVVEVPVNKRFFVTTKIQYSRNDMIQQVIMHRKEGFRFLAALGYRM